MAKKKTLIAESSDRRRYAKRSLATSKPERPNRKATNNLAEPCSWRKGSGEGVNNKNSSGKVRTKCHKKQSATTIATKCQKVKLSSNQNPETIYESELERSLRLQMAKLKPLSKKQIGSKCGTTIAYSSLRQVSTFSRTTNANNPCSDLNSNVSPLASRNGDKVLSIVDSLKPSKPITVHVWKFNDGTSVKKIY